MSKKNHLNLDRLVLVEQSDPALHCLLYEMSLGCSHRLYAYAHGILFLRVLGSLDPVPTDPRGAV